MIHNTVKEGGNISPGKLADLPKNIYASIENGMLKITDGGLVTFLDFDPAKFLDGAKGNEAWRDDFIVGRDSYYLSVKSMPSGDIRVSVQEWIWHEGAKHLTGNSSALDVQPPAPAATPKEAPKSPARDLKSPAASLQKSKEAPKSSEVANKDILASKLAATLNKRKIIDTSTEAPKKVEKKAIPDTDTSTVSAPENNMILQMASTTSIKNAKTMSLARDLTEDQRTLWKEVVDYMEREASRSKYYTILMESTLKGKVLTEENIIELCKLMEKANREGI